MRIGDKVTIFGYRSGHEEQGTVDKIYKTHFSVFMGEHGSVGFMFDNELNLLKYKMNIKSLRKEKLNKICR